jgi:hypothetical protein
MSTATDLYKSFIDYLEVTFRAIPQGDDDFINVNERFTLRLTVRNRAPDDFPFRNPKIHYRKIRASIQATVFATPLDDQGQPIDRVSANFSDPVLTPGETSTIRVSMRALQNLGGFEDFFGGQERIAHVQVRAEIDQEAFFQVRKALDPETEIEPT